MAQLWARFYKNADPSQPNNPEFEDAEVPWEVDPVNELLEEAFPGDHGWYVRPSSLNLALALGKNAYGTYELPVESRKAKAVGYVWATISGWPTLPPKPKKPPAYDDKVTGRLMKDALKSHGKDFCPKCKSRELHFYRTVLRCNRCLSHVGGC